MTTQNSTVNSRDVRSDASSDPDLEAELARLRVPAPDGFIDAVLARLALVDGGGIPEREYVRVDRPFGDLYVVYGEDGISHVFAVALAGETAEEFEATYSAEVGGTVRPGERPPAGLDEALESGDGRSLHYDLGTCTPFQRAVLEKALEIPSGEVRPYGWVAREIGHPKAVRAVGTALGRNPVPVLIPCHRVVRTDGTIGNYGLGTPMKHGILRHEGVDVPELERLASAGVHIVANDETQVFCLPSCRAVRRIAAGHMVRYRDAAQAAAAGNRPCSHCRPVAVPA